MNGTSSRQDLPLTVDPSLRSIGHMLRRRIEQTPHRRAFTYPDRFENWQAVSWRNLGDEVSEVASGLLALGISPGERIVIASTTRYEWAVAAYAIACSGAATVAVYPSTIEEDVAFIIGDSGSTVVFADDAEQLRKLTRIREHIPMVHTVVMLDSSVAANLPEGTDSDWVISFEELRARGIDRRKERPHEVDARIDSTDVEDLATLIYTSGTTGQPKGVLLPHRVWVHEVHALDETANASGSEALLTPDDKHLLWLPLAHVMGKLLLILPLHIGYETAIDGRVERISDNLGATQPTFMASVPRIFERVYTGVATMMADKGPAAEYLFTWASEACIRVFNADNGIGTATALDRFKAKIGDRLVMSKIRERFGGQIRYFICGSAALDSDIATWFGAAGLPILEGYGMTESNVVTLGLPGSFRAGTAGAPLKGFEISIADDGEIRVRGPGVMSGYHRKPERTAETLTTDGWLHTGDTGRLDDSGQLLITDRKSELFKTSAGKFVAPANIEARFKAICPMVSNIVVIGLNRPYVSALVTLDTEAITAWATREGIGGDYAAIVSDPRTRNMVQGYIDELNDGLNPWERVRQFQILPREFSIENQEVTPSLKLRRRIVAERFTEEIKKNYA